MEKSNLISDFRVVIFGGSAGSLEVLLKILPKLKTPISFALVIVVHRKNSEDSTLEELIALKTTIPVREVEDKILLEPGSIYIAPSDYHLLFEKSNLLSLDTSEKVNYSRPSIDVAFESAAEVYGDLLTGILLSGANSDGTHGLNAIRQLGGITVVQNPETAEMPFMPQNAIASEKPDYIFNAEEIIQLIDSIGW